MRIVEMACRTAAGGTDQTSQGFTETDFYRFTYSYLNSV